MKSYYLLWWSLGRQSLYKKIDDGYHLIACKWGGVWISFDPPEGEGKDFNPNLTEEEAAMILFQCRRLV